MDVVMLPGGDVQLTMTPKELDEVCIDLCDDDCTTPLFKSSEKLKELRDELLP